MSSSVYVNLPDGTPDKRKFWLSEEQFLKHRNGRPKPNFGVGESSALFFGRSTIWLQTLLKQPDMFVLDGNVLRIRYTPEGQRFLSLADIERIAHALFENYPAFDLLRLATTINIVKYCALAWGYLDMQGNRVHGEDIPSPWKNTNVVLGEGDQWLNS